MTRQTITATMAVRTLDAAATAQLRKLTKKINHGLQVVQDLGVERNVMIQATGRWLIEAKRLVGHGNRKTSGPFTLTDSRGWEPWVKAHLHCDPDTAAFYMLVARELGNPEWIRFLPPTLTMQVALARLAKRGRGKQGTFFPELEPESERRKLAEPSGRVILEAAIANGDIHPEMTGEDIRRLSDRGRSTTGPPQAAWDQAQEERTLRSALRQAVLHVVEGLLARCPGDVSWVEDALRESDVTDAVADELRKRREKRARLTPTGVDILTGLQQEYEALPGIALYVHEARALKRVLDGKIASWHEVELLDETLDAQSVPMTEEDAR
jgi:hypothetical protein